VGTIGGGTQLDSQVSFLNMFKVKGENVESPIVNAQRLEIGVGVVLAGELSLVFGLATSQLVKSHMKFKKRIQRNNHHLINDLFIIVGIHTPQPNKVMGNIFHSVIIHFISRWFVYQSNEGQ
jgi:hypothetical protein